LDRADRTSIPIIRSLTLTREGPGCLANLLRGFHHQISMANTSALRDGSTHYLTR
jgi:hypothetical protein